MSDENDKLLCPYCGAVQDDVWDVFEPGDDEEEFDCGTCCRPFYAVQRVHYTYRSSRK